MPSKKKKDTSPIGYLRKLKMLRDSGLEGSVMVNHTVNPLDDLPTLEERVSRILGLLRSNKIISDEMLFFVMYDIESDKVRVQIAKYLERMGCFRIQKSIFLANLSMQTYETIKNDLAEVQSLYDNHDSILVCPVSSDLLSSMKIIGQNINLDVITRSKNTLFF